MKRRHFFIVSVLIVLTACSDSKSKTNQAKEVELKDIESILVEENKPIPISEKSFFGITPGSSIADYGTIVTKGRISTDEGVIEVFNIEQRGVEIGYLLPDAGDETKVGNIFIQSPKAVTEHGFKIGTTFKEILEKYPKVEVFGSEIENRTVAVIGRIHYRLNFDSRQDELHTDSISDDAPVKEIVIRK